MCWSKFLQNHPHASRAINIAPILSPPPLSESSFSNLHSRKRIGLIGRLTCPHTLPEFHCNVNYAPHALHAPLAAHWRHSLTPSVDVICHVSPSCLLADVTWWCHHPISTQLGYVSLCWLLTVDFDPELTFCSPGAPYPVFRIDFIFAVHFCIFCF